MDWLDWEPILKKVVVEEIGKAPEVSKAHGLDHLERVWRRCLKVGMKVNADLEVLVAAAYLHDLGRHYGLDVHGQKSAELAEPVLEKINFPEGKRGNVLESIRLHDHYTPKGERSLLEAQILYDADKLDAFGPIGVTRWITYYYARGESIDWMLDSMKKRYGDLHLDESRVIGKKNYEYTINFFKKLREDLKVE